MIIRYLKIFIFLTVIHVINGQNQKKPNIVLILADDMGMNDVSFRGSNQFLTPNIDALAYNGMILDKYYVPALCTPSRATLLTGKFLTHTGTQVFVIPNDEPWGMPLNETTMPEIFRNAGYSTNLVGKWHLGFHKKAFTPTLRGFDYHFGYLGGYIDYWDRTLYMTDRSYSRGYDFRKNLNVTHEGSGVYATDLFTNEACRLINDHNKENPLFLMVTHLAPHTGNEDDPLQAPDDEIHKFRYISNPYRRIYAAMVSKLDKSVGQIVKSLANNNMLENTIIVFYSDNGAPTVGMHGNSGSNHPLRGQKNSPWEGGVRTPGLIFSPLLKNRNILWSQTMHASDWLPTLASAAGITLDQKLNLDGLDLWNDMVNGSGNQQRRIVHNINEIQNYTSYQRGPWKYISGTTSSGGYDSWLGEIGSENDPRANKYNEAIKNSEVSQVLSQKSYKLTDEIITQLRNNSKIQCPETRNASLAYLYKCKPLVDSCLFNIEVDPCEKYNLAQEYPQILSSMKADVEYFKKTAVEPARVNWRDPQCDPKLNDGLWTWWQDKQNISESTAVRFSDNYLSTFIISLGSSIIILVVLSGNKFF